MSGVNAEANRGEHARCLSIAADAIARGELDKAERFLGKAERLLAGDARAAGLARQCREERRKRQPGPSSSSGGGGGGGAGGADDLRRRAAPARAGGASTSSGPSRPREDEGTPEQRRLIQTILAAGHDYYKILGVERGADDEAIKRAYRKLALKLHPDKNKARGATDAFKNVSKAFSCLSDSEKRASYDRWGSEDGPMGRAGGGAGGFARGRGSYSEFSGADIDPEEIFNAFFGGAFGGTPFGHTRVYTNRNQQRYYQQQQQQQQRGHAASQANGLRNLITSLMQILPLLLIFATTFLSSSGMQEPMYSIERNNKFNVMHATANADVKFYVKSDGAFERRFPYNSRDRRRLESKVEIEYRDLLGQKCYVERVNYYNRNRDHGGPKQGVKSSDMPSCHALRELEKKLF